jgi:methyl-accepting chemotaxis protein
MPTVFERIDVAMEGGDLTARVSVQTGHLAEAATLLADFVADPPGSVGDFVTGIGEVALPRLDVAGDLTGIFQTLGAALPIDFASVIQGAVTVSGSLTSNVNERLLPEIEKLVQGINALGDLITRVDALVPVVEAEAAGPSGGVEGGPSGGSGAGEPAPTHAEARREEKAQAVAQINQALDQVPEPLGASAVVEFAREQLSLVPRGLVPMPYVPLLDDLLYLFDTTVDLRASDAAALEAHIRGAAQELASFLRGAGAAPVDALVEDLEAAAAELDAPALATRTWVLVEGLGRLAAAVRSGDLGGIDADVGAMNDALDELLPQLDHLRAELFAGRVDTLVGRFERLTSDMDAALRRVSHATLPPNYLRLFEGVGAALEEAVDASGVAELTESMRKVLEGMADSLDKVDVSALAEPVDAVLGELRAACEEIDRVLSDVASECAALFDEVDRLLDEVDLSTVTDEVRAALESFTDALAQQVDALFGPMKAAIASAVGAIGGVLEQFDPEDVIDSLEEAIGSLADALDNPEVTALIGQIKGALEGVTGGVMTLSFRPVTDEVVAAINGVTEILRTLDPSLLSPPATLALNAAVALLPADLFPVTNPLKAEFRGLLETGPFPLLDQVREQPARLLDRVKSYGPADLIGSQLSGPFDELVGELKAVSPIDDLLAPVQAALESAAERLRGSADPAALLAPLQTHYDALLARLDAADPASLVRPVREALDAAVSAVLEAVPLDEFFGIFDDIVARVRASIETAVGFRDMVDKTMRILDDLSDPEQELRDWLEPTIQRVDEIADLGAVQAAFDEMSAALDGLAGGALEARVDQHLVPLRDALTELEPGRLLSSLSTTYRAVRRPDVNALPDSLQKTALITLLNRLDPVATTFASPYRGLQRWLDALGLHEATWREFLPAWTRRTGEGHGPLARLRHDAIAKPELKEVLRQGFEDEIITPIAGVLRAVGAGAEAVAAPMNEMTHFVDELEAKLEQLLAGPEAMGEVRDALNALAGRIRDVDVDFLVDEMREIFDAVKGKFEPISPHALAAVLTDAFDDVIRSLDVAALLPADELESVAQAYDQIVASVEQLDPTRLVVDAVQPIFDERIVPLIDAFDLTAVIDALIEGITGLRVDLEIELERVNQAYKEMLAAVPPFSPFDISLDVDISVDIGF